MAVRHSSVQYQPQFGQRIILDLWPQQHGQRRALRVSLGQFQWGGTSQTAPGGPTVLRASGGSPQTLILPELRKSIRRKRSVSRLIADCDGRDNAPASECLRPDWPACSPLNAVACADEPRKA